MERQGAGMGLRFCVFAWLISGGFTAGDADEMDTCAADGHSHSGACARARSASTLQPGLSREVVDLRQPLLSTEEVQKVLDIVYGLQHRWDCNMIGGEATLGELKRKVKQAPDLKYLADLIEAVEASDFRECSVGRSINFNNFKDLPRFNSQLGWLAERVRDAVRQENPEISVEIAPESQMFYFKILNFTTLKSVISSEVIAKFTPVHVDGLHKTFLRDSAVCDPRFPAEERTGCTNTPPDATRTWVLSLQAPQGTGLQIWDLYEPSDGKAVDGAGHPKPYPSFQKLFEGTVQAMHHVVPYRAGHLVGFPGNRFHKVQPPDVLDGVRLTMHVHGVMVGSKLWLFS